MCKETVENVRQSQRNMKKTTGSNFWMMMVKDDLRCLIQHCKINNEIVQMDSREWNGIGGEEKEEEEDLHARQSRMYDRAEIFRAMMRKKRTYDFVYLAKFSNGLIRRCSSDPFMVWSTGGSLLFNSDSPIGVSSTVWFNSYKINFASLHQCKFYLMGVDIAQERLLWFMWKFGVPSKAFAATAPKTIDNVISSSSPSIISDGQGR
nr:hypothetical protein CFP56_19106 [Quercus suber]